MERHHGRITWTILKKWEWAWCVEKCKKPDEPTFAEFLWEKVI